MKTRVLLTLIIALLLCGKAHSQGQIVIGNGSNPGCVGSFVTLLMIDMQNPGAGPIQAEWYVNGNFVIFDIPFNIQILATDQSIVAMAAGNPPINANFTILAGIPLPATPTITLITGNVLHSSATTGNQWYNQNGIITGATSQNYTPIIAGDYYVIVTENTCSSNQSNTIHVTITGVNQSEWNNSIRTYPNPVANELIIEMAENQDLVRFEIVNSIGQIVLKENLTEKTIVQTSNFTLGVYLIKLENGKTFKFEKR